MPVRWRGFRSPSPCVPWITGSSKPHCMKCAHPPGRKYSPKKTLSFILREALRKGRSVAILADQNAGGEGIDAPFFGKPARTTPAPAALAVLYNRPIVLISCLRKGDGRRYEVLVSEPIVPDMDAQSAKGEIERLTRVVNVETENFIRKGPEQYLWIHDRWKLTKKVGPARWADSN